ncbi:MAG: hypothetical protein WD847_00475 [Pirellulales bacterium]
MRATITIKTLAWTACLLLAPLVAGCRRPSDPIPPQAEPEAEADEADGAAQ